MRGGGAKKTLAFILPEKTTDLQIGPELMSCCIYNSPDGFVDTMPVIPGGKELTYSYQIPNVSGDYVFSRKINYPTIKYDLLIQSGLVQNISSQLTQQDPLEISGTQFSHFSGSDFSPDDTLAAKISGLSKDNGQTIFTWVTIALLLLVSGSVSVYILQKRRLQPVRLESRPPEREELLAELARLDNDFDSGQIDEEVYQRLRTEKKSQLVTLMQRTKKSRGNE
ncbi:hypothetical protein ACFLVH_03260 [Chloroflexota bacterium]